MLLEGSAELRVVYRADAAERGQLLEQPDECSGEINTNKLNAGNKLNDAEAARVCLNAVDVIHPLAKEDVGRKSCGEGVRVTDLQELVEEEREPVGQHLLCHRLRSDTQQQTTQLKQQQQTTSLNS